MSKAKVKLCGPSVKQQVVWHVCLALSPPVHLLLVATDVTCSLVTWGGGLCPVSPFTSLKRSLEGHLPCLWIHDQFFFLFQNFPWAISNQGQLYLLCFILQGMFYVMAELSIHPEQRDFGTAQMLWQHQHFQSKPWAIFIYCPMWGMTSSH